MTVAQWLGERSYSLYLWHWPLVVALYFTSVENDWRWVSIAFATSLLLAHLSYHLVENPSRRYFTNSSALKEIVILGLAGLIIGLAASSVKLNGFKERPANQTPQAQYLSQFYDRENSKRIQERSENYLQKCNFFDGKNMIAKADPINKSCTTTATGGIFLWGDSHAQALSYGIRNFLIQHPETPFSQVASSGCRPHLRKDTKTRGEFKKSCDRSNNFALRAIKEIQPELVIMAQKDEHMDNNLPLIGNELLKLGVKNILIIGPEPQWDIDLPRIIARNYWSGNTTKIKDLNFKQYLIKIDGDLKNSVGLMKNKKIQYASVIDKLCSEQEGCVAILDTNHTPLVFDYGHLTREGSIYVTDQVLAPYINATLYSK